MNKMAYWQHFLAVESELVQASHWVEITKRNRKAYSIGFAHVMLAACSDYHVPWRLMCGLPVGGTAPNGRDRALWSTMMQDFRKSSAA